MDSYTAEGGEGFDRGLVDRVVLSTRMQNSASFRVSCEGISSCLLRQIHHIKSVKLTSKNFIQLS